MHDDDLLDLLGGLDPVGVDDAPEPGSPRYHRILESAMNATTTITDTTTDEKPASAARPSAVPASDARPARSGATSPSSWRARAPRLLAAAAVLVVIAVGAMTLRPGGTPSAEAQIRSAADSLGEIESLRATLTTTEDDGTVSTATGEFSGADAMIVDRYVPAGETVERESGFSVIGGTVYSFEDGEVTSAEPVGPNDRMTPFAEASAQVLSAAVTGADITELGTAELDGVTVDRFLLTMTDESRAALASLTPFELAWFELEYPQDVVTIEVSVADDLIHAITVTPTEGRGIGVRELRYFDFNEQITIVAPGS